LCFTPFEIKILIKKNPRGVFAARGFIFLKPSYLAQRKTALSSKIMLIMIMPKLESVSLISRLPNNYCRTEYHKQSGLSIGLKYLTLCSYLTVKMVPLQIKQIK
jgi:hypothetical protein